MAGLGDLESYSTDSQNMGARRIYDLDSYDTDSQGMGSTGTATPDWMDTQGTSAQDINRPGSNVGLFGGETTQLDTGRNANTAATIASAGIDLATNVGFSLAEIGLARAMAERARNLEESKVSYFERMEMFKREFQERLEQQVMVEETMDRYKQGGLNNIQNEAAHIQERTQ
jgi:hypothetical protein